MLPLGEFPALDTLRSIDASSPTIQRPTMVYRIFDRQKNVENLGGRSPWSWHRIIYIAGVVDPSTAIGTHLSHKHLGRLLRSLRRSGSCYWKSVTRYCVFLGWSPNIVLLIIHVLHGSTSISSFSGNKYIFVMNSCILLTEDRMKQLIDVFLVIIRLVLSTQQQRPFVVLEAVLVHTISCTCQRLSDKYLEDNKFSNNCGILSTNYLNSYRFVPIILAEARNVFLLLKNWISSLIVDW